jgi:hypothetical protein
MKNITLSVDDEVYHSARVEAARRHTSVSALVRTFLVALPAGGAAADAEVAERNRLMEALLRRTAHFRVGRKPTREEMHER